MLFEHVIISVTGGVNNFLCEEILSPNNLHFGSMNNIICVNDGHVQCGMKFDELFFMQDLIKLSVDDFLIACNECILRSEILQACSKLYTFDCSLKLLLTQHRKVDKFLKKF